MLLCWTWNHGKNNPIKLKLLEHKVNAGDDCGTFLVHALPPPLHVLLDIHPLGCPAGSNIFLNSVVVKSDDINVTCFPQRIDKILFSVPEFCCSPLHAWSACLPCWLGIQRGGTCNNQPMPILVYPGDEALPLSTILTWRVQNWSSILGCCHWHGIPGISYLHIGMSYS